MLCQVLDTQLSQQRCEIERWFQRTTYRNPHVASPIDTWPMTSRDLKRAGRSWPQNLSKLDFSTTVQGRVPLWVQGSCSPVRQSLTLIVTPKYQVVNIFEGQYLNRRWVQIDHLHLRHQHSYIVLLFSPLSPLHWPPNTWPRMTLNGHFRSSFNCYEQRFQNLFLYTFFVVPRYQQRCAEADRDPQHDIWYRRKNCGSFVDERLRSYFVGTLASKANIIIYCYLVPYRLSSDSKIRDLEWPWMAILR